MISILAGFAYIDLLFLEKRILEGITVAELEYNLLEMRRQEKNAFLYNDSNALKTAEQLVDTELKLIVQYNEELLLITSKNNIANFQNHLWIYRDLLSQYNQSSKQQNDLKEKIRKQGHYLLVLANDLVNYERKNLARSVKRSQWALLISIVIACFLAIIIGYMLTQSILTPLKKLISDLDLIADGQFEHLEPYSDNQEINNFSKAFNHMLIELETRRKRILYSEKLASLGVLVTGVAHEINNPLSNISSSCQLMIEELENHQSQLVGWTQTIDQETQRIQNIIQALMDVSRKRGLHIESVNLVSLIDQTSLLLKGVLSHHHAKLKINIPSTLFVLVDYQRFQQILINLIHNAIEQQKIVIMCISADNCQLKRENFSTNSNVIDHLMVNKPSVQLVIEDNGDGIEKEVLNHVFDPFFTQRKSNRGLGLGLYIVQEIIQELNGCIAIDSEVGGGTRVTLRLPCQMEGE